MDEHNSPCYHTQVDPRCSNSTHRFWRWALLFVSIALFLNCKSGATEQTADHFISGSNTSGVSTTFWRRRSLCRRNIWSPGFFCGKSAHFCSDIILKKNKQHRQWLSCHFKLTFSQKKDRNYQKFPCSVSIRTKKFYADSDTLNKDS